jgi:hypothetical protein
LGTETDSGNLGYLKPTYFHENTLGNGYKLPENYDVSNYDNYNTYRNLNTALGSPTNIKGLVSGFFERKMNEDKDDIGDLFPVSLPTSINL